jgi:hypothetical protein
VQNETSSQLAPSLLAGCGVAGGVANLARLADGNGLRRHALSSIKQPEHVASHAEFHRPSLGHHW